MKKKLRFYSIVLSSIFVLALSLITVVAVNSQYYNIVLESNRNARNVQLDPSLYLKMDDAEMRALSNQIVCITITQKLRQSMIGSVPTFTMT